MNKIVFDEDVKKKFIIFFVIILFVAIIVWSFVKAGSQGVKAVIKTTIKYVVIVLIVGILAWAAYKIFFTKPDVNLVANDRKDIIEAGILTKPPLLRDLYFTGDKEHGESRVGRILGYCQIQSYERAADGNVMEEDCFVFKKFRFPLSLFEAPKVFRCFPHEHSQLIGDVRVFAVSPIFKYGYFFPNSAFLNVRRIDQSIVKEAYRGLIHETLKDLVSITQRASGMDAEQRKQLEYRKLLKIPSSLSEEESRMQH